MAMNHLIETKQIKVNALVNLIDFPSTIQESVFSKVHIHVYHEEEMFSKFMFRANRYDNYSISINNTHLIPFYCLNIALESKRKHPHEIYNIFKELVIKKKNANLK